MDNPWVNISETDPFIAPCDVAVFKKSTYNIDGLRFDAFPEPYGGSLDRAKVVCLLLNPGFEDADVTTNFTNPYWVREVRANLEHKTECNFMYLSPALRETGGYRWWTAKLRPLEEAGVTRDELIHGVMMIEFFPYHSVKYIHNREYIPSQHYQFYLVREAMWLGKIIIIMRAHDKWLEAVPELADYPYLALNSYLNVSISRANLDNKNGLGTFEKVVATLHPTSYNHTV